MAKRKSESESDPFAGGEQSGFAPAAAGPAVVEAEPIQSEPKVEPPAARPRKPRNPNQLRPWYQIQGIDRYTGAVRILLGADTIGQARKKILDAVQASGGICDAVRIVRCKAVE